MSGPDVGGEDPAVEIVFAEIDKLTDPRTDQLTPWKASVAAVAALRSAGVLSPGQDDHDPVEAARVDGFQRGLAARDEQIRYGATLREAMEAAAEGIKSEDEEHARQALSGGPEGIWVCPVCGETLDREDGSVDAQCAGSRVGGTEHERTPMEER
jgi:ribosomal protein L37AE/L43A